MKRDFVIRVDYFKPSGKWYCDGILQHECTDCGQPDHPTCCMDDAAQEIKRRRSDGQLPGLSSGGWEGPILLNCEECYPVLILS